MSKEKQYVIARTYSAGVFAGFLKSRNGKEAVLNDARRIWYWAGAATLGDGDGYGYGYGYGYGTGYGDGYG